MVRWRPTPNPVVVLIAGTNPVAVDYVATELMGFDWRQIPTLREAFAINDLKLADFSPDEIEVLPELGQAFQFNPHFGWKDHIETPTR